MAVVTPEDHQAMVKILNLFNDSTEVSDNSNLRSKSKIVETTPYKGRPDVVSDVDVSAMSNILSKLNSVKPGNTVLTENSVSNPELLEAFETEKTKNGVAIGKYQILIKEDAKRLAGKQYYSIYHTSSNDVIADDISLYETALTVVRLLNTGKYLNSVEIRKLFEYDDTYTSHRMDALLYKRRLNKCFDPVKTDIFESRYQSSIDKAMTAKKQIKLLANDR